jgi:hypothetical protein
MLPKLAPALCKQKVLHFWGLTAQRGWACLILGRFHVFMLSSGDPTAAMREQNPASHENHTFFFPDIGRGAANTAGFSWPDDSGV